VVPRIDVTGSDGTAGGDSKAIVKRAPADGPHRRALRVKVLPIRVPLAAQRRLHGRPLGLPLLQRRREWLETIQLLLCILHYLHVLLVVERLYTRW
jgi:hypothetical protein